MATMMRAASAAVAVAAGGWIVRHRTSPAVRAWRPSRRTATDSDALAGTIGGSGATTVLLLHGLGATGDYFGRSFDRLASVGRIVVPDLLGFGRSLDDHRTDFGPEAHLDALDRLMADLGADGPVLVGAHSMGTAVALKWARRHPERALGVVAWGPPMHTDPDDAKRAIGATGPMAKVFLLNTKWAERVCRVNCAHRVLAGIVAASVDPTLPVAITRRASLHTWPAYRQSIDRLVIDVGWADDLAALDQADVPVLLVQGSDDRIGDRHMIEMSSSGSASTAHEIVPQADHHLPITHAHLAVDHLIAMLDRIGES